MFSVEIDFHDGVSAPETVLVRRPHFSIGGSEGAQVSVEDMRQLQYDLQVSREIGRRFRCRPVATKTGADIPAFLSGVYEGSTRIDLGNVSLNITSLDLDLALRDGESPDRAGVRIVRQASVSKAPRLPALVFPGTSPFVVSFVPDQPVYIGRAKECTVRLDAQEISGRHARVGYEGGQFWIEDLGSTNGTFIKGQQVSGRSNFSPGSSVQLGRETVLFGVNSEDQLNSIIRSKEDRRAILPERRYPVLLSISEVVRPARMVVQIGATIHIGRDPKSEMWLGAPHISRQHCQVALSKTGSLTVTDCSTNGTSYDGGLLQKGDSIDLHGKARVLDFGGSVTVAICFSAEDERIFVESGGSLSSFIGLEQKAPVEEETVYPVSSKRNVESTSRSYRPLEVKEDTGIAVRDVVEFFSSLSPIKKFVTVLWLGAALVMATIVGSLLVGLFH